MFSQPSVSTFSMLHYLLQGSYLFKLCLQYSMAQCGLPLQLPPTVLTQIEQLEHLLEFYHLPEHKNIICINTVLDRIS